MPKGEEERYIVNLSEGAAEARKLPPGQRRADPSRKRRALPWHERTAPNRVRPADCIAAARDALTKAYSTGDWRAAVIHMRDANDWLRRGLEQMAAVVEEEESEVDDG